MKKMLTIHKRFTRYRGYRPTSIEHCMSSIIVGCPHWHLKLIWDVYGCPIVAEVNISPLWHIEKMLVIHKRLNRDIIFLLNTNSKSKLSRHGSLYWSEALASDRKVIVPKPPSKIRSQCMQKRVNAEDVRSISTEYKYKTRSGHQDTCYVVRNYAGNVKNKIPSKYLVQPLYKMTASMLF